MYKLSQDPNYVIRLSDNAWIPLVEGNRDYEDYVKWRDGWTEFKTTEELISTTVTHGTIDNRFESVSMSSSIVPTSEVLASYQPNIPAPCYSFEELKLKAIQELAAKRYEVEVSGIVWNGLSVSTDRESQSKITSAFIRSVDINWKFSNGEFKLLSKDEFADLATKVFDHVNSAYIRESELLSGLKSANSIDELKFTW